MAFTMTGKPVVIATGAELGTEIMREYDSVYPGGAHRGVVANGLAVLLSATDTGATATEKLTQMRAVVDSFAARIQA
jgi:hypothetical protein